MTTDELQRSLADARLSRNELSRRMGIDRRTIARWFQQGLVPAKYERQTRAALRPELPDPPRPEPPDDVELLADVAARFAWYAARVSELETLLAGLSPDAGQIRLQGTRADKPESSTRRASWGRGPRQRDERDEDVPHDEDN